MGQFKEATPRFPIGIRQNVEVSLGILKAHAPCTQPSVPVRRLVFAMDIYSLGVSVSCATVYLRLC